MKKFQITVMITLIMVSSAYAQDDNTYRLEAGVGYATSSLNSDYLNESVGIGSGPAVAINFWKDSAFDIPFLSLGTSYKYHYAEKSINTVAYRGSVDTYAHDFLLKLALRNNTSFQSEVHFPPVHPYAGIGVGVTHLRTDISDETTTGYTATGYIGLDYDIPNTNYYLGVEGSYTRTWAEIYSTDFTLDTMDALFKLGFRF